MADDRVERRLAAILAADVVGYSRLVEADEAGTVARLKALQAEVIRPRVAADGGRVVKVMGDGVLVEFASAVDAVRNALAVQAEMARRNAGAPEDRRIAFRVGVNLGDVIIDGDDIQGDGVNLAARLEALCDPGEVYVSGGVFDQVAGKLDARFDDLGERTVKNIVRPVRVYRARPAAPAPTEAAAAGATIALPDRPSIAVLPFQNMSGDPDQEYFADGIAEDIITELSRFRWFFVIARNSSFSYKGTSPDVRQVARELGVQYVLEGSVRKAGNRVRITAQLIDALSGRHVWAERYDRDLDDIFAVQDEITRAIAAAAGPEFVSAEALRVGRKPPENLDAWDCAIRGNWHLWRLGRDNLAEARRLFQRAADLDPTSVMALSGLALACSWQVVWGWADDPAATRALATEAAQRAIAADGRDAWARAALSLINMHTRDFAGAIGAARRAVDLNPNLATAEGVLALSHAWLGDYDEAMVHADRAERLSPRDSTQAWWALARTTAAFVSGRYEEQVASARRMIDATPDHPAGWRHLAAGLALLDRTDEAEAAVREYRRLVPHETIARLRPTMPVGRPEDLDRMLDALRKAGLPE